MVTLKVSCHHSTPSSPLTSSQHLSLTFSSSSSATVLHKSTLRFPATWSASPSSSLQLRPALCFSTPVVVRKGSTCRARAALSPRMATGVKEVHPPALTSASEPPPVFDGATRLYISYTCPYAQRTWITRNCKGLQDKIILVPIDLKDRPTWYKEKVYPPNKVPSLEHNNEVKGESLDLIKYIDTHFEGPLLFPDAPEKREFAEELFTYVDSFTKAVTSSFKGEGDHNAAAAFDELEKALAKFDDGPFFLGQFSLVDIAYVPFIERFRPFILDVKKIDITEGRPNLTRWIEEMNKNEAYTQTTNDPKLYVESYKQRFSVSA